ncbi:MAG: hypothetical protein LBU73_04630 [Helicobacteraceae bacterium]|jgi:hypothetical protein|nr:hypothetical protein [Helicobacteraceae bacterium]
MARKFALFALFLAALAADSLKLHDSGILLDWDNAAQYCRSLDANVPTLAMMEATFWGGYSSRAGRIPYQRDTYWTSDELDFDGAYAFDFAAGLHTVDYKNSRHRVMCAKGSYE